MQIGEEPDAISPGVRNELQMRGLGQGGNLAQLEDSFGQQGIRLQDVVTAAINEQLELVKAMIVLSSGNPDAAQTTLMSSRGSAL